MLEKIKEIREESSKNGKIELLKKYGTHEFLKLIELTYSPLIRFGISVNRLPEDLEPTLVDGSKLPRDHEMAIIDSLTLLYSEGLKGHAVEEFLTHLMIQLPVEYQDLLKLVIDKSLKLGCNVSSINKAYGKGFIKEAPYMGAVSYSPKKVANLFSKEEVLVSQMKMDGRFTNVVISDEVSMESRQGLPTFFNGVFDNLKELRSLKGDIVLNGELMVDGYEKDRLTGNGIVSSLVSIGEKINDGIDVSKEKIKFKNRFGSSYEDMLLNLKVVVWDVIPLNVYLTQDSYDQPYSERFALLSSMLKKASLSNIELVESVFVRSEDEAKQHFSSVLSKGLEGTILKSLCSGWKNTKPSYQVKFKKEITFDLRITGGNLGTKGSKNEGLISSLNVESQCGLLKTSPGGMSELMMKEVTENLDSLIGTIVTVKCNGISSDRNGNYSVYHPAVVEFRDDKQVADDLQTCLLIDQGSSSI